MSYEHLRGLMGGTPHTTTGSPMTSITSRPHLSLVQFRCGRSLRSCAGHDRPVARPRVVRANGPRGVLSGKGRLHSRGQENLPGLRGPGRMPRLRLSSRRAVRHLGRPVRAGTPPPQARNHLTQRLLLVIDRRVDDRRLDVQIGGDLGHQDLVQQFGEFDGILGAPLDWLAEQHNSRPGGTSRARRRRR